MNEDRRKVIESLCPYTGHISETNSASVGPVADALININESIQQLQLRANEASVCREAQTKRISRGENKRLELQNELNGAVSFSREQGRIIRDLAKRITKLEGGNGMRPWEDQVQARNERVISTQNVFVVSTPNGGVAVYEEIDRAIAACKRVPGAVLGKRRLMRGN